MAPATTAPTPSQPGRWIISEFGGPSVLKWSTFDQLPDPAKDEVRVRIITTGVGAVDNIQRAGGYPDPNLSKPGFTPGYEFVGEVDAVGSEVTSLNVGTRVTSMCKTGGYATHTVLPARECFAIPETDDPVKVAALPLNYLTAYGMLRRSGVSLSKGSTVLVGSAAGGIGCAIAELNTAFDMGLKLYGTCSPRSFKLLESLGMIPVDRHTADLPARIKELIGGRGVDVAFNAEGSEESIKQSFACTVQDTGEVRIIGVMSSIAPGGTGMENDKLSKTMSLLHSATLPRTAFWSVTEDYRDIDRKAFNEDFEEILLAVREGRLSPMIGKLFRLDAAIEVNELLARGAAFGGHMEFVVDAELAQAKGL